MCSTFTVQSYYECLTHFEDVDLVIGKVKSAAVENKTRRPKFAAICSLTSAGCYKMGKLIKCCLVLCKDFVESKAIEESFEGSGILVAQAKVSLLTTRLATQILKIKDQYKCLV